MRYSTFLYFYWIGLHAHFQKAILHLKTANGRILFRLSVFDLNLKDFATICDNLSYLDIKFGILVYIKAIILTDLALAPSSKQLIIREGEGKSFMDSL